MRGSMLAMLVVALGALCIIVSAGPARNLALLAHAKQSRAPRGFQNSQLMTARGFGKRASGFSVPNYHGAYGYGKRNLHVGEDQPEQIRPETEDQIDEISALAKQMMDNIPVDFFVSEMMMHPDLTEAVVRRFIDINQDGVLSPAELMREDY